MDFRGAGQPFRLSHQAESCAVVAIESAFRAGPDVTRLILGKGKDDRVLEALSGSVQAKAVLLCDGGDAQCQRDRDGFAEAPTSYHPKSPSQHANRNR